MTIIQYKGIKMLKKPAEDLVEGITKASIYHCNSVDWRGCSRRLAPGSQTAGFQE